MNFQELLNDLCNKLSCSQRDLSASSGLSAPVISRYLSGERTPAINSEQLHALARGLSAIASDKNIISTEYGYEQILTCLMDALRLQDEQYNTFLTNFNSLIEHFDIKVKELANGISFDTSFLYRVRSGERRPADIDSFCNLIACYVAERYTSQSVLELAASLFHCDLEELTTKDSYAQQILHYLNKPLNTSNTPVNVNEFLNKMDEFNLDEYIEVIHFNDIKIPTSPIHFPISRHYYGIADMRKAELDFFKTTVLSKSMEPVFMYGDMPMTDMAEDMDFNKKWMFGIAAALKKGLRINIIHNLDRPFEEIMLGLEAWIPIYMTGQVSPYHLEGYQNNIFHQLNYCSGSAALFGECIDNYHSDGRYYLSTNKHDIDYYRTKTNALLTHAKPLMDIYNSSKANEYISFLKKSMSNVKEDRHIIAAGLPLYTMPEDMLTNMISSLSADIQENIMNYYHMLKDATSSILEHNRIVYDCHILSETEFKEQTQSIAIPDLFIPPIREYTYDEYTAHVKATRSYHESNKNFVLNESGEAAFKNIHITIIPKHYFIVSKWKTPNIHFIIRHSAMLSAMENFYAVKKE